MISHCGFDFSFSWWLLMCNMFWCLLVGHLCFFSWKIFIEVLCLFLNWIVLFCCWICWFADRFWISSFVNQVVLKYIFCLSWLIFPSMNCFLWCAENSWFDIIYFFPFALRILVQKTSPMSLTFSFSNFLDLKI